MCSFYYNDDWDFSACRRKWTQARYFTISDRGKTKNICFIKRLSGGKNVIYA